jgi:hypothetical protein
MVASTVECMLYFFSEEQMIRFRRFLPLAAALVTAVSLGMPARAQAAFTLTLHETGFTDVVVTDNNILSGDVNPAPGQITYIFGFGDFSTNINIGTSNSTPPTTPAMLTINNVEATSHVAGATLTVTLEDTGFKAPGAGPVTVTSQLSNTQTPLASATVTYQTFINATGFTKITETSTSGNVVIADPGTVPGPYTLKSVTTITVNPFLVGSASVQTTGSSVVDVAAVPAPAGVVLALAGTPILGFGCWLRRRRQVVTQLA